jgi:hypothetical protein
VADRGYDAVEELRLARGADQQINAVTDTAGAAAPAPPSSTPIAFRPDAPPVGALPNPPPDPEARRLAFFAALLAALVASDQHPDLYPTLYDALEPFFTQHPELAASFVGSPDDPALQALVEPYNDGWAHYELSNVLAQIGFAQWQWKEEHRPAGQGAGWWDTFTAGAQAFVLGGGDPSTFGNPFSPLQRGPGAARSAIPKSLRSDSRRTSKTTMWTPSSSATRSRRAILVRFGAPIFLS